MTKATPGDTVPVTAPFVGVTTIYMSNEGSYVEPLRVDLGQGAGLEWFELDPNEPGDPPFAYTVPPGTTVTFCPRCWGWSGPSMGDLELYYRIEWEAYPRAMRVRRVIHSD